jgi:hypothetical protein
MIPANLWAICDSLDGERGTIGTRNKRRAAPAEAAERSTTERVR